MRRVRFLIVRRSRGRTGYRSSWEGAAEASSARDEARFLVDDPRDTIERICLWDERHQQFSGVVSRHPRRTS
jgi:hypothetical protein